MSTHATQNILFHILVGSLLNINTKYIQTAFTHAHKSHFAN